MDTTKRLTYIAGPCVLESAELALSIAHSLKEYVAGLPVDFVFKASYDKANRTALGAYRGPGLEAGLEMLRAVREAAGVRVLTDVHDVHDVARVAGSVDVIQVPAFLSRQTDLLVEAARSGRTVNVKKGQFMAPDDMKYVVDKLVGSGAKDIWLTERGVSFGYNTLVVDFRAFTTLRGLGFPVIFDATHSVQIPSQGGASSGNREYVLPLARAAAAYGVDGLFTEVYPEPDTAKCDGPNSIRLDSVPELLRQVLAAREITRSRG
jgi:2-dehydro-3-deoxyphosphooctonate aldolase (KDO 8-P synthase)